MRVVAVTVPIGPGPQTDQINLHAIAMRLVRRFYWGQLCLAGAPGRSMVHCRSWLHKSGFPS
eukprot:10021115-Alexandrium_andersonii.AAC.1